MIKKVSLSFEKEKNKMTKTKYKLMWKWRNVFNYSICLLILTNIKVEIRTCTFFIIFSILNQQLRKVNLLSLIPCWMSLRLIFCLYCSLRHKCYFSTVVVSFLPRPSFLPGRCHHLRWCLSLFRSFTRSSMTNSELSKNYIQFLDSYLLLNVALYCGPDWGRRWSFEHFLFDFDQKMLLRT